MRKSYYLHQEDIDILQGLQSDTRQRYAFERDLYNRYSYFIGEGAARYKLSDDDSFSAYSDAVLSFIQNVSSGRFDGRSSVKTYLFQIFSNKCIDLVRKNTTNKQQVNQSAGSPELLTQLPDEARAVIEKLIDQQKLAAVKQQVTQLGDKCRDVLLLFEEGYTDKQVAEELSYSTAAVVKTTRLRCLEKLREKVSALFI